MSPSKIFNNFFKKMYSKNMSMRTIISFTIVIITGSTMFGDNNCCEQCCEYLENCCKKGKEEENKEGEEVEVQEEFYLKKSKATDPEEIKKLVSPKWYSDKGKETSFILYEKIDGGANQNLNKDDIIKVTKYKNGFSIDKNFISENDNNEQKWALFEIKYKKEGEGEETVYLYCNDIESIEDNGIFKSCEQYISISVIDCNTSKVTKMTSMFYKCSSLTKLDLSNFNTDNVTNMDDMFYNCSSLTKLDLSNFNTKNVKDMSVMFCDCSSLTKLDLSNFNTETVTDMYAMFSGCASLQQLNLSKFDTKKVTNMDNMFLDCDSLQTVTFNENLNEGIKQQLNDLGLTEVKEEENKITLEKKQ